MCIDCIEPRTERRNITKGLPFRKDRYVTLWKVFDIHDNKLIAQFNDYEFQTGKNTATGKVIKAYSGGVADIQYKPGFHCFTNRKDANEWKNSCRNSDRQRVIKTVKIRKGWITGIGEQGGLTVVICKHIIIEE